MLAETVEQAPKDSAPLSRQQLLLHLSRHSESVSSFQAEGLPSRLGQVLLLQLFRLHTSIVGVFALSAPPHFAYPSKPWDRCGSPREELPLYLRTQLSRRASSGRRVGEPLEGTPEIADCEQSGTRPAGLPRGRGRKPLFTEAG